MSEEKDLISTLMANYDRVGKAGRPVYNISRPVKVYFGLGLIQLDLDEKNKILTMSMWTRYQWRDEYLMWNSSEYGGVRSIRLPHNSIWIPDVTLYNTADVSNNYRDALAAIGSDGTVHWYPHTIYRSSCAIDVTNFPYDHQACHMWFGSWTHTTDEVDLHMAFEGGIDLTTFQEDYKETCAWQILTVSANRSIMPSEDHNPNYAVVKFNLQMKRKLVFSTYILTLPCVFLACLTLVVFWLPPERPDRIGLAMSIFSSFMLLLLILVEAAPPTASSVPKLGVYYSFNMVIIMVSIILSSIIINISRGFSHPVPRWLFMLTNSKISRLLCGRYINQKGRNKRRQSHNSRDKKDKKSLTNLLSRGTTYANTNNCPTTNGDCGNSTTTRYDRHKPPYSKYPIPGYPSYSLSNLSLQDTHFPHQTDNNQSAHDRAEMRNALDSIGANLSQLSSTVERLELYMYNAGGDECDIGIGKYSMQWRQVAVVLDRVFFLIYVMLVVGSLCTLFPRESEDMPEATVKG